MVEEMMIEKPWAKLTMVKDTVFQHEDYEEETFKRLQSMGKLGVTVDIGAHQGLYTTYLASVSDEVYAFEPHPLNFKYLKKNCEPFDNVHLHNHALSFIWKILYLTEFDPDIDGNTGKHGATQYEFACNQFPALTGTLDDIIPESVKVDFIKIDTEGWEQAVIRGAQRIIMQYKPVVLVEIHSEKDYNEIIDWIEAWELDAEVYEDGVKSLNHQKPFIMINWRA